MLDKKGRILELTGVVDEEMYKKTIKACATLRDDSRLIVYLNTPGGSLIHGFGIYDVLRLHFPKTTIICTGEVMSAGTVILSAATTKLSLPSTEFMLHYGEYSASSLNEARANNRAFKRMKDIIKQNVNVKPKTVDDWFERETFLTAKQALKYGLIDKIIGD